MSDIGIRHSTSVVYTPQQNGTSERMNRTIMDSARSMMFSSNATSFLWAEAANFAVYIRNRVTSLQKEITPYEINYKQKPDVSHIKIFGSKTFVQTPDVKRKKNGSKMHGRFLGWQL